MNPMCMTMNRSGHRDTYRLSKRMLAIGVLIFLASSPVFARQTLYLPFDGSYASDSATLNRVFSHVGIENYQAGYRGKALQVGGMFGNLNLSTENIFSAKQGSVSVWVSPVDWNADDDDFHVFFDARGSGALVLYKYFQESRVQFLATRDIEQSNLNVLVGKRVDWKPGEWAHLVATWSYQGIRLYVNGVPVAQLPTMTELPLALTNSFQLGDLSWGRPRTSSTLMDEVRFFDTALTPGQVKELFSGKSGNAIYSKLNAESLLVVHESTSKSGIAVTTEWSHDVENQPVNFTVIVVCAKGNEVFRQDEIARTTLHHVVLPLPQCTAGEGFSIKVRVNGSSGVLFEKSVGMDSIAPELLVGVAKNSRPLSPRLMGGDGAIAAMSVVPASAILSPWFSPREEGTKVNVWGRQYQLDNGVLGSGIFSQNLAVVPGAINVLYGAEPLELVSTSGVKRDALNSPEVNIESEYIATDGFRLQLKGRLFYDGIYLVSMRVNQATRLARDIEIAIPLNQSLLRRWHRFNGKSLDNTGKLPTGTGVVLNSSYSPYLWVGNENVGLTWFAETDRHWPNASQSDAVEVVRTQSGAVLKLNIASAGKSLSKDWRFEFGLQPTPVKAPMVSKGSRWRFAPLTKPDIEVLWPENSDRSFRYYGYPEARNTQRFTAEIQRRQAAGIQTAPYLCPTFISTLAPEWRSYGSQWSMKRFDSTSVDVMASGGALAMVSPRSSSWQAFFTRKLETFLRDYQPRALYFDNSQLYGASAPKVGVGYIADDKAQPEYPLLAYRDLFAKISEVADRSGDNVRILHVSGQLNPLIAAFGHYYLNGEQYRGVVSDSYLDILSLAEFRQQFSAQWSGASPIFIPGFSATNAASTQPTHEMLGLLFLHDVAVWPVLCNLNVAQREIDILTAAIPPSARFVRYDDPALPLAVSSAQVVVSAHVSNSSGALLVAMNTGNKTEAQICLNSRVDTGAAVIEDRLTGKTFKRNSPGCYRVQFPDRGYRLLRQ